MDLKNYFDEKYTYGDEVLQLVYLNCLFLKVLRIFRPEIPNLIHLLQYACVHFSGAGRSIFHFFAPKSFFYRAATFEPTRFIPKA